FLGNYGAPGALWDGGCCDNFANVINGQTWLNGVPVDGRTTLRPRSLSVISLVTTGDTRASNFGRARDWDLWWGDLAELIVYDRPLSSVERKAIEDYLQVKYGLGGSVLSPVITPNGGVFTGSVTVTLTTPTPHAEIHYTLDGTEPTETSASYAGPLTLTETTTLKAKAFLDGLPESPTATAGFTSSGEFSPAN